MMVKKLNINNFAEEYRGRKGYLTISSHALQKIANLSHHGRKKIDKILYSLEENPSVSHDILFPSTSIGTAHVRCLDGNYVLYQIFNSEKGISIKVWWVGSYSEDHDVKIFDFELDNPK